MRKVIQESSPVNLWPGTYFTFDLQDCRNEGGQLIVYSLENWENGSRTSVHNEKYILATIKLHWFGPSRGAIGITAHRGINDSPPDETLCNFLEEYRKLKYGSARFV